MNVHYVDGRYLLPFIFYSGQPIVRERSFIARAMSGGFASRAAKISTMTSDLRFSFDNTYLRELGEGYCVPWQAATAPAPQLVYFDPALAAELNPQPAELDPARLAQQLSGNAPPSGAQPIAQVYAGHQFGNFSPRLGDGRALLLGEVLDRTGARRDLALKGSGRTPFSRGGDGKAAIGPMLREVLISECLHALGIPTTRSLAVVFTGESIFREEVLPGAVLTRVAASHLRVGTFQYFAARGENDKIRRLADYAIQRHDPTLLSLEEPDRFSALLRAVVSRQARLLAQWMNVGFIHGVMNTDNMTISGETIDYGPCAFLEDFDPDRWFSSIDLYGRYAYKNQPEIALWNLSRFAECLLPLMSSDTDQAVAVATEILAGFESQYQTALVAGQCAKLGLRGDDRQAVGALIKDWLSLLHSQKVDFTLAWRLLTDEARLERLFEDRVSLQAWLLRWRTIGELEDPGGAARRIEAMRSVNPRIIARNHLVEEALKAASEEGRMVPFERLLEALRQPFSDDSGLDRFAQPAPREVTACYRTFCGT
jgi:uncharacterized protein YdiU (UPF0061 family)